MAQVTKAQRLFYLERRIQLFNTLQGTGRGLVPSEYEEMRLIERRLNTFTPHNNKMLGLYGALADVYHEAHK